MGTFVESIIRLIFGVNCVLEVDTLPGYKVLVLVYVTNTTQLITTIAVHSPLSTEIYGQYAQIIWLLSSK